MRDYFSIGEVSKMTGFTINALRHYDKIGLCKPTYVNEETNYRYYHANQLFIFEIINFAKRINLPLEDLRQMFETHSMNDFKEFLEALQESMIEQIEVLKTNIIDITNIQDQIKTSEVLANTSGLYQREIDERNIVTSDVFTLSTNNRYVKQMEQIELRAKELDVTTTFETGTIYKLQNQLLPVMTYKGVILNYDTDTSSITQIPEGTYLCITYTENTKEEAFTTLIEGINELQIVNPLIIDATLLNNVFSQEETAHELQVYVGDIV